MSKRKVEVKFKSRVDDMVLEFFYAGTLTLGENKVLSYQEEMEDKIIDTEIYLNDDIVINRTNGVQMYQEFVVGERTVMDYQIEGMKFQLFLDTKEIVNDEDHLKIVYSTIQADVIQEHELEIFYS